MQIRKAILKVQFWHASIRWNFEEGYSSYMCKIESNVFKPPSSNVPNHSITKETLRFQLVVLILQFYAEDLWKGKRTGDVKSVPSSYCWSAVFSPLRVVIYYWSLEFSAFWWAKCLFISSSILISSLDRDFFTSYVFMVRTLSRVSFSDLRIETSLLWKFISS